MNNVECCKCGGHAGEVIKVSEYEGQQLCSYCLVAYATLKYSTVKLDWWNRHK